jgi:hypothetical protein
MSTILTAPPEAPVRGAWSPWGAVDGVEVLAEGVVFVSTPSHGGAWLSTAAQTRMPGPLQPMHGRMWWEEDCEVWAPLLVFDVHDADNTRGRAIAILARWKPGWLDALAGRCGVPNAAQAARIADLWTRFGVVGAPDLAAFPREADTGMVHGWIGAALFVGIEPDGRAHS